MPVCFVVAFLIVCFLLCCSFWANKDVYINSTCLWSCVSWSKSDVGDQYSHCVLDRFSVCRWDSIVYHKWLMSSPWTFSFVCLYLPSIVAVNAIASSLSFFITPDGSTKKHDVSHTPGLSVNSHLQEIPCVQSLSVNLLKSRGDYSATSNDMSWYTGRWWVGCYIWYGAADPPRPHVWAGPFVICK